MRGITRGASVTGAIDAMDFLRALTAVRGRLLEADGLPQACSYCLSVLLGRAYDQANQADSTIANLERYLSMPNPFRVEVRTRLAALRRTLPQ